ncbi:MBL fold metallo-hydrolase [Arthrobacter sp. MMS18-M83]|uniref:MBL fold metallo-hydrolase n=1 Tax=Arthrobacter sp. MMS18-M83 TaxID=2996261 RepID=UPI00227D649F|nr:MBL fold metallo-hydrolase [Arthrobacter sp. MMS18-M83]WAH96313.1 MBL fold metallo-hydrolase [Arthrobacter sp. MMS18-M83]
MGVSNIMVTGHAQKAAWQDKVLPGVEQVRKGVWSIPVPFPGHPIRYTLSYLLAGRDGYVLIDTGWNGEVGWRHLVEGIAAAGAALADLAGIVVTHHHADHLGLASRLREASGTWVGMGELENVRALDSDEIAAQAQADRHRLVSWGVPPDKADQIAVDALQIPSNTRGLQPDLRLADGELIPVDGLRLRVVSTPGHTPGHVCLVDEEHDLVFSGDHVLPRISPNVSLQLHGPANPLADYHSSLARLAHDDQMEVCPAHEYRFVGMRRRVDELMELSRRRSEEVLEVLGSGNVRTVWELSRQLHWSRGWESLQGPSLRLALGETASHVVYLQSAGHDIDVPVRPALQALASES